ncbi:RDD family protein [Cellulomonas sp. P22]|uniref:RDD family protein n=1 Tax=Cellulomonas sp. P22 TaxID=3373189 RepID=UPI003789681B
MTSPLPVAPPTPAPLPYGDVAAPAPYAPWISRVGSRLLDILLYLPLAIIAEVVAATMSEPGATTGTAVLTPAGALVIVVLILLDLALWVWNIGLLGGRTGSTLGKRALGTRLVLTSTGQPVGVGMALLRDLLHVLDNFLFLGYLWPLWDARRQTFADKIVSSVVVTNG